MKEDMGVAKKMTVKFWITRAERVFLHKARQTLLFAVYHGWKWGIAVKVGMKEDIDVADEMTLANLVSRSMRNRRLTLFNLWLSQKVRYYGLMMWEGREKGGTGCFRPAQIACTELSDLSIN